MVIADGSAACPVVLVVAGQEVVVLRVLRGKTIIDTSWGPSWKAPRFYRGVVAIITALVIVMAVVGVVWLGWQLVSVIMRGWAFLSSLSGR